MVFFVVVGEWQRERDREMKTGQEWVSDEHLQIWTTWVLVAALLFLVGFCFWVLVIRTVRRRRRSWPPAMISSSSSSEKQALHTSACSEAAESIVAGSAEAVAAAMISQDTKHMKICSVQITDEELHNFIEVLRKEEDIDSGDDEPPWENTVEKKSRIVAYSAKRRDPKVSKIPSRKSPTPHLFFFSSLSLSLSSVKLQITDRFLIRSVCS
jgi:cytoskeletal protein RodZ